MLLVKINQQCTEQSCNYFNRKHYVSYTSYIKETSLITELSDWNTLSCIMKPSTKVLSGRNDELWTSHQTAEDSLCPRRMEDVSRDCELSSKGVFVYNAIQTMSVEAKLVTHLNVSQINYNYCIASFFNILHYM